jgi:hypothetical protein
MVTRRKILDYHPATVLVVEAIETIQEITKGKEYKVLDSFRDSSHNLYYNVEGDTGNYPTLKATRFKPVLCTLKIQD